MTLFKIENLINLNFVILFKISCVLFSGEHFVMCKCCKFCQITENCKQ